ncbi:MAG: hypothetical protein AB1696_10670 [Planctomycetota bacterium]
MKASRFLLVSGRTARRYAALLCLGVFFAGCEVAPPAGKTPQEGLSANNTPDENKQDTESAIRNDIYAHYCCAWEAIYQRQYALAVEHFEKALEKCKQIGEDPPEIHEALVECYPLLPGNHEDKIAAHIETLTRLVPNDFSYHAELGNFYSGQGKDAEALREYERAAECPPPSVGEWRQIRFNHALLLRKLDQSDKSIEILHDVVKKAEGRLSDAEAYNVNYLLAGCHIDRREFEKAIPFLEKCVEIDSAGRDQRMSFVLWQLGFCYTFAEKLGSAEAIQRASKLLLQLPRFHELRYWLALLHRKQKDDLRAQQLLQEIIDGKYARPQQAPLLRAYLELAQIEIDKKDYRQAVAILQKGVAEIPQRSLQQSEARQLRLKLVSACSTLGEDEKVVDELHKILATDPEFPSANNYLGYLYADKGVKLREAIALIERALKAEPDSGAYMDSLGWAYYKIASADDEKDYLALALQKLRESLDMLKKNAADAGEEFDDDPVVRDHLGDICFCLGLWEEAKDAWETAVRLSEKFSDRSADMLPDVEHVKKKLARVTRLLAEDKKETTVPSQDLSQ